MVYSLHLAQENTLILSTLMISTTVLGTVFHLLLPLTPWPDIAGIVFIAVVVSYAILNEGPKNGLGFFAISAIIGLLSETTGVLFGLPFGRYHYNAIEPLLFNLVPLRVILLWFVVTYTAKSLTDILIGPDRTSKNIVAIVFLDATIATTWDILMDPVMVNLVGLWTWEPAGPFFGVPVSNYVGWILVSYTICLVYRLSGSLRARTATPITAYLSLIWPLIFISIYYSRYELIFGGIIAILIVVIALTRQFQLGRSNMPKCALS